MKCSLLWQEANEVILDVVINSGIVMNSFHFFIIAVTSDFFILNVSVSI